MKTLINAAIWSSIAVISCINAQAASEHSYQFPDFGFMLSPQDYHGQVFKLSTNYPKSKPGLDRDLKRILAIDFRQGWKQYALAVRDYVFKNNINLKDNARSFDFSGSQSRRWFHVPWQHWGSSGREGFHGLTREGPLAAYSLSTQQQHSSSAYAVGFYNRQGGYAIGQVWKNPADPNPNYVATQGFPIGTVVAKFLFTTLDSAEVPFLVNPLEWTAYVYVCDLPGNQDLPCSNRVARSVRLLQMDIMVKDPRARQSNAWVFGTFVYNGLLNRKNPWQNLQPVGLMWGNDPENRNSHSNPRPTETIINDKLSTTRINTDKTLPAQHLGWNGRLNGPADNPYSSCMSCHSTAQFPAVSSILPQFNNPPVPVPENGSEAGSDWMRWFRNFDGNVAFDQGQAVTTDFSLQLSKSLQNFIEYRSQDQQGCFTVSYWMRGHKVSRGHPPEAPGNNQGCR